ncbi:tyrosine-protein phosphatase [Patulibacter sp. NPDC049589]|uniref:tyrosine-protein phosphatase n=1 Tax=Patulibacter sp. NPDC049589 TaxID=3154731 RepID=UPI00342E5E27
MFPDCASVLPDLVDGTGLAAVPGTVNFRSIGPVDQVRAGVIWRSDGLSDLGPEGRDALSVLGIRTIVDLRQRIEREQHPDDVGGLDVVVHTEAVLGGGLDVDTISGIDDLYRRIVDARGAQLTGAVRALAAPGALPAVVHCSAGKDRTGLVAALVLSAVGVPDDVIAADYARTADLLRGEALKQVHRRAVEAGLGEQRIAVALTAPPAAMTEALRNLQDAHGGAEAYLRRHGMQDPEFEALRAALALGG